MGLNSSLSSLNFSSSAELAVEDEADGMGEVVTIDPR